MGHILNLRCINSHSTDRINQIGTARKHGRHICNVSKIDIAEISNIPQNSVVSEPLVYSVRGWCYLLLNSGIEYNLCNFVLIKFSVNQNTA